MNRSRSLHRFLCLTIVAVLLSAGLSSPLHAQIDKPIFLPIISRPNPFIQNVELVSHIGGLSKAVAAHGGYAFAGFDNEFAVFDVSNSEQPHRIAYLLFRQQIVDIHVLNNYAYVALQRSMHVIDISDPAHPYVVGAYEPDWNSERFIIDMALASDRAYLVVEYDQPMLIVDLTNPAEPIPIVDSTHPNHPKAVSSVATDGEYVYVITASMAGYTLHIMDFSAPLSPIIIGIYDFGRSARDLVVDNGRALVTTEGAVLIVDVSDPTKPRRAGIIPLNVSRITFSGNYVYAYETSYTGDLFHILDLSDPAHPEIAASMELVGSTSHSFGDVTIDGTAVYILAGAGLHIIDVSQANRPIKRSFSGGGSVFRVAQAGNHLVLIGDAAVHILDTFPVDAPTVIGSLSLYRMSSIAISGDYAYVGRRGNMYSSGGFWSIDLSDPSRPRIIGSLNIFDAAEMAISGNYVYVVGYMALYVVDVSDPTLPRQVGEFPLGATFSPYDITLAGNLAFIVDYESGMTVLDLSNPTQPALVTHYRGPEPFYSRFLSIEVTGAVAYIGMESALHLVDISTPAEPVPIGIVNYGWNQKVVDITIVGNRAYLALGSPFWEPSLQEGGLWVLDISAPEHPHAIGYYITPELATDVSVSDDHIFLARGGLYILQDLSH